MYLEESNTVCPHCDEEAIKIVDIRYPDLVWIIFCEGHHVVVNDYIVDHDWRIAWQFPQQNP